MNTQEQGEYTFHAKSNLTNASITFQVKMYRKLRFKSRIKQIIIIVVIIVVVLYYI